MTGAGAVGNNQSTFPGISGDGAFIAFQSNASDLYALDNNNASDVFIRHHASGTTECVSQDLSGFTGNLASFRPSVSLDGSLITFESDASDLISGDNNNARDIFMRNRVANTTIRISVDTNGGQSNGASQNACVSSNGAIVSFDSIAMDLVPNDTNLASDAFVRQHKPESGSKYCLAFFNSTGLPADISSSGSAIASVGNLMLFSAPVPNQSGIFFHGQMQTQVVFGNGFLCATGGIARGAVTVASGNLATYTYNNSNSEHSLQAYAGMTRHFQHWYRDTMGGGSLYNTSNAISILILP